MGAGISSWTLARTVSRKGQLGVVSGVGLDLLLSRRLQSGDPGGHLRRALAAFPVPGIAGRILREHYVAAGRTRFRPMPMHGALDSAKLLEITVAANFCEVWLAKDGHEGLVGINYLEKMQFPVLPAIYGSLLAGVDVVLMGAGIPRDIPGVLDRLAVHEAVSIPVHVEGAAREDAYRLSFEPAIIGVRDLPTAAPLKRPLFFAIIASVALARTMARKASGRVDGFVIEGPTAGGHNAPPRGSSVSNDRGEPVYGPRDEVDLDAIRELGLPFWLAGGYATREGLADAIARGAHGVQVGTAFAFSRESGLSEELKAALLRKTVRGEAQVCTDASASPTGFPFKVARLEGTLSETEVYEGRERVCDLGCLRRAYRRADGTVGYRCPAEPVDQYVRKGGARSETVGRKCLCNALTANIGLAQERAGGFIEPALVTSGDDLVNLSRFLGSGRESYSAADVIERILPA